MTKEFISTWQLLAPHEILTQEEMDEYTIQGHPYASLEDQEEDLYMLLSMFVERELVSEDIYNDGGEHHNLRRVGETDFYEIDYRLVEFQ